MLIKQTQEEKFNKINLKLNSYNKNLNLKIFYGKQHGNNKEILSLIFSTGYIINSKEDIKKTLRYIYQTYQNLNQLHIL